MSKNYIMAQINEETIKRVKVLLASWNVFRQKAHTYHWNVNGKFFKNLHELFGDLYDSAVEQMDSLAERLRQIGEPVPMTLRSSTELSELPDENPLSSADDMMRDILSALATLNVIQTEICLAANDQKDNVTMDLMIKLSQLVEMKSWFIKSYLEEDKK